MTALDLLNFLVLQWFGVRLARKYRNVVDLPASQFAAVLESMLHNVLAETYGIDTVKVSATVTKRVRDGWCVIRWVWPLTGWWSEYRWISRK